MKMRTEKKNRFHFHGSDTPNLLYVGPSDERQGERESVCECV